MSRDIKFRAWNLVAIPKRMMSHKDICFYKDLKMYELFCDTTDNRPWIIMQYTGLHDKNGKEIYEGDLVKDNSDSYIYQIAFVDAQWRVFRHTGAIENGWLLCTYFNKKYGLEVIGNIYENADLLK